MDRNDKNAVIAAALIVAVFGIGAFYLPVLMLALGDISTVLAGIVAVLFVGAFFLLFWLRSKARKQTGKAALDAQTGRQQQQADQQDQ